MIKRIVSGSFCTTTLLLAVLVIFFSCKRESMPPQVVTSSVTDVGCSTMVCTGMISTNGGMDIMEKGFCWAQQSNPTIDDYKTTINNGDLEYSSSIEGLSPLNTYWVRAFAINAHGIAYGNTIKVTTLPLPGLTATDADGNTYHSVVIGTQTWMLENLKVRHYNNGDSIPFVTHPVIWSSPYPRICVYDNDMNYMNEYGLLYNWYVVNDPRGIAPSGWRIPTKEDWQTLTDYLGGEFCAGKLKEAGIVHWIYGNTGATNESGFTALPCGIRYWDGVYELMYYYSIF